MLCEARAVANTKEALPLLRTNQVGWDLKRGKPSQNLAVALAEDESTACGLGLANEPTYEFNMRLDRIISGGLSTTDEFGEIVYRFRHGVQDGGIDTYGDAA